MITRIYSEHAGSCYPAVATEFTETGTCFQSSQLWKIAGTFDIADND